MRSKLEIQIRFRKKNLLLKSCLTSWIVSPDHYVAFNEPRQTSHKISSLLFGKGCLSDVAIVMLAFDMSSNTLVKQSLRIERRDTMSKA